MNCPSDAELWDAVAEVLTTNPEPLEVQRVAQAAKMSEGEVISALIRESLPRRAAVRFRFPPLPCAAITGINC